MPRPVDLHGNLFYSYRGSNVNDVTRERQLENNVTKALINTLDLGGCSVWGPFLSEFLGLENVRGAEFLLQRRDLPSGTTATKPQRILLGVSQRRCDGIDLGTSRAYDGVPDAWVYGEGFAVLIESKVNETAFSQEQMQAHLARLQSAEYGPPRIVLKTWSEVHGFFTRLLHRLADHAPASMLVGQLVEFLEYCGMSEFTGFRLDHFHYFLLHDDEDARCWIRGQVGQLAARVRASLHEFAPFYEAYDVGKLGRDADYCWVALGPKGDAYRQVTHQTMSLAANGLRIFVNTELKAATERLKSALRKSGATLRAALMQLHEFEPFELVLEERTHRRAQNYDYTPKMRLHSSVYDQPIGEVAWAAFTQTIDQIPLPYLRIERLVPAQKLIELSQGGPSPVVQHVVEILRRNHAVVNLLNK